MCQSVIFAKSNKECTTVKELKEALPNLEFIKCDSYKTINENGLFVPIRFR